MKTFKRMLAVILVLVMAMSFTTGMAFAADDGIITIKPPTGETLDGRTFDIYLLFEAEVSSDGGTGTNIIYNWNSALNSDPADVKTNKYYKFFDENATLALKDNFTISDVISAIDEKYSDATADSFANELYEYISNPTNGIEPTKSLTADGEELDFTGLKHGYYLIYERTTLTNGQIRSAVILTNADPSITVTIKLGTPAFEKMVSRNNGAEDSRTSATLGEVISVADNKANVTGDLLTFHLNIEVPDFTKYSKHTGIAVEGVDQDLEFTVTDTWDSSITPLWDTMKIYKNGVLSVTGITGIDEYCTVTQEANKMTIDFNHARIKLWQPEDKIVITYDAILNETAEVNHKVDDVDTILSHKNTATIEYSSDPYDVDKTSTLTSAATVNTYGINVLKVNGISQPLTGATFKLGYKLGENTVWAQIENNKIVNWGAEANATLITDTNGAFTIKGLGTGDYVLVEKDIPSGYKVTSDTYEFTVGENVTGTALTVSGSSTNQYMSFPGGIKGDGILSAQIINLPAGELPETGGMGTTMFIFGGIILMAGAAAFLVLKKKEAK